LKEETAQPILVKEKSQPKENSTGKKLEAKENLSLKTISWGGGPRLEKRQSV